MNYQELQQSFLRRQHTRIAVRFAKTTKLFMLPTRATLNDVYRQLDAPRTYVQLYTDFGMVVPRTDEYCSHFFRRAGVAAWHSKPLCYSLFCHTGPVHDMVTIAQPIAAEEGQEMITLAEVTKHLQELDEAAAQLSKSS